MTSLRNRAMGSAGTRGRSGRFRQSGAPPVAPCLQRQRPRHQRGLRRVNVYCSLHTLMDFMPVSASVRVLYTLSPTTVVVVVVGFRSTIVHFFVLASRTT